MPGSVARKERRRKEREGMQTPDVSRAAVVESVDDEGESRGGAEQAAEGKHADGNEDIPSSVRKPPKGFHSHEQRAAHPVSTSPGKRVYDRDQAQQKKSKNRSKRDPPPRVPRESEPPSVPNHPSSVYEEAIETLQNMTAEESLRLRNVVLRQMAADSFPLPPDDAINAQGVKYPMRSITNPPWAPRKKDIMTEDQAEHLRQTMFAKLSESKEQVSLAIPLAKVFHDSKSAQPPVLQTVGGNLDGASQSAEIVTPEIEAPFGEQASVAQPEENENQAKVDSILLSEADATTTPSGPIDQKAPGDGTITTNIKNSEMAGDVLEQGKIAEASAASEHVRLVTDTSDHTDRVARVDDMTKKLRQSVEKARAEIQPNREGTTLDRGFTHHSSSSDYASSSGDSGNKPYASRTRRITNDGILELKASPFKVGPTKGSHKDHLRKVSLKLPVNISTPQRANARRTTQHTHIPSVSTEDGIVPCYDAEERELEYQHRHIFVGTASLDDFLEILEITPAYNTTKRQVVKAFGILACAEQVQARQSSISSDGWNFVTRTTHEDILTHTDYLTEAHVKLGSISLGKFLSKIPFDDKGEIAATKVVDAFCLASHLDGEATCGVQSKAKVFRSWYVREVATVRDS